MAIFVSLVLIAFVIKSYRSAGAEEGVLISVYAQYGASSALHNYYDAHGAFPPLTEAGLYYGPLTDQLTTTVIIKDLVLYEGPPIDAQRKNQLFPGEELKTAKYFGKYSKLFYKKNRGFPQRYYRSADGEVAVLLANGPDEDVDIDPILVLKNLSKETTMTAFATLHPLSYDATNGVPSSGDIWRMVTPD